MTTAEDRDQWERDEEALRAQESAQISTHSPDEGSRVAPDPARVAYPVRAAETWMATAPKSLADEERAALVAELKQVRKQWHQEVENFERETLRAEAAEAKVAKVEAIAVWLDAHQDQSLVTSDYPMIARWLRDVVLAGAPTAAEFARTYFADAPAERPDLDRPCACGHLLTDHLDGLACYAGTTVTSEFACDCREWRPGAPAEQRAEGGA